MRVCECGKPTQKRGTKCSACYTRKSRAGETRSNAGPKTPEARTIRYGDRYSIGFVWEVENKEKGGCATVTMCNDGKTEPVYKPIPLWQLAEMDCIKTNHGAPIAAVFVGLPEVKA